jgi:hypothetical protein
MLVFLLAHDTVVKQELAGKRCRTCLQAVIELSFMCTDILALLQCKDAVPAPATVLNPAAEPDTT